MDWYRSPAQTYGSSFINAKPHQPDDARELAHAAGPAPGKAGSPFSPHSPLFWFGIIAGASVGLMAYSTSVRVGPIGASVSVGK